MIDEHLVIRQPLVAKIVLGVIAAPGVGLAIAAVITGLLDKTLTVIDAAQYVGLLVASAALGLHFSTTEVHATSSRLWLRRYGFTWWSIAMQEAGTTGGEGDNWRFVFVFDVKTGRRVGKINWYMFDRRDILRFSAFVDTARQARGVALSPASP